MAQAPQLKSFGDPSFEAGFDQRGFYVHRYPAAQLMMADTMAPGARHLNTEHEETGQPAKVLLLTPELRQVGTHLGPQLFEGTAHLFKACAWILPDHLPMIVGRELTRHIDDIFPFAVFRYREEAEDWLIRQS